MLRIFFWRTSPFSKHQVQIETFVCAEVYTYSHRTVVPLWVETLTIWKADSADPLFLRHHISLAVSSCENGAIVRDGVSQLYYYYYLHIFFSTRNLHFPINSILKHIVHIIKYRRSKQTLYLLYKVNVWSENLLTNFRWLIGFFK